MRRILFVTVVLVVAASTAGATGKQATIINGLNANGAPWFPPSFPNGCRIQMLYGQARINYSGTINEFELQKHRPRTCTVTNVKFYLCHTKLAALTTNFNDNYAGNTPVLVANYATYVVPARAGFYPIPMTETFAYNNKDNLILEITYEKITGFVCNLLCGRVSLHRCYAYSPTAETGTADEIAYNGRISFSYYTAVSPTSLGRVKALYQ